LGFQIKFFSPIPYFKSNSFEQFLLVFPSFFSLYFLNLEVGLFYSFLFKAAKVQNIKGTTFFERTAEISSYGTNLNKKYLGKVATMKNI
jgi:hypothetical protein